jgi:hypothetical protein
MRGGAGWQLPHGRVCLNGRMRLLIPMALAVAVLVLPEGGGASATTRLDVSPKHGRAWTTFTVSWRAPYPAGNGRGQYVIGAVHSGECHTGYSSFGRISKAVIAPGQRVVFRLRRPPHGGWCPGVFHGVGHWQKREGDRTRDIRMGRFAFRVIG